MKALSSIIILYLTSSVIGDKPCAPKLEDGYESAVCVCNSTYCDEISKIEKQSGKFVLYTSSKNGLRFRKVEGKTTIYKMDEPKQPEDFFSRVFEIFFPVGRGQNLAKIVLNVNREKMNQTIEGFGGGFSEAAAIHYIDMNKKLREHLITSYFSENGLEYNFGKVPIGNSDYATRFHTYNSQPENDTKLSNFSLSVEDYDYKMTFIKTARKAATDELKLIGAAWSPPLWMKTNRQYGRSGELLEEYYQTWADYHLKFLKEYEKSDIKFWAITSGNEPTKRAKKFRIYHSLGWYSNKQMKWIAENLGPTIKSEENFPNVKIITADCSKISIAPWLKSMTENPEAMKYIDGIGIHSYFDGNLPSFSELTPDSYKGKFLFTTQAVFGPIDNEFKVILGSWNRTVYYIKDMIDEFNHWSIGWLDWNLVLDRIGGPSWFYAFSDTPIHYYKDKEEFVKQPMFYGIGHFSKFVPRGSVKIEVNQTSGAEVDKIAFLRPDGGVAVIFYNGNPNNHQVVIKEKGIGQLSILVPPHSINTCVYWE